MMSVLLLLVLLQAVAVEAFVSVPSNIASRGIIGQQSFPTAARKHAVGGVRSKVGGGLKMEVELFGSQGSRSPLVWSGFERILPN